MFLILFIIFGQVPCSRFFKQAIYFYKGFIKQIFNYINGDVKDITTRVQKLSDLSKQYNNFTMLNGNNEGNVKFIMIIDAIKKQEDTTKEQAILNNSEDNKNENKENN